MKYGCLLLRYGEIFLKGKNKVVFERKLVSNIKKIIGVEVRLLRARLVTEYINDHEKLRRILGLVSYSPAIRVDKEMDDIKKAALGVLRLKKGTFKVVTKRSDKRFPIKSPDLNVQLGQYIESSLKNLEFSFKDPEHVLNVEINQEGAYLFTEVISCFGGLPVGVEGKVTLLYEGMESIVAGWLMMKRGVGLDVFCLDKVKDLEILQKFSSNEIKVLDNLNKSSLVSGQNFDNLKDYKFDQAVFRPLVAFSEREIKEKFDKIKNV